MTVIYESGNSLYINLTNRCSNDCSFCVRNFTDGIAEGQSLWLESEPSIESVVAEIQKKQVGRYKEFVFCGYGEPMMRAADVLEICRRLKTMFLIPIRMNTNGQANLICGQDITPQFKGLIDVVSISLNAKNQQDYQKICRSVYGEKAYEAILDFAVRCQAYVPKVLLSVVDVITKEDIDACREIARRAGFELRVRHFG